MALKVIFFEDKQQAATKLFRDVGSNNVKVYNVIDYEKIANIPVHPPTLTDKLSSVYVVCSGDATSGKDWLSIVTCRVDTSGTKGDKVIDHDTVLFVLDSDTGQPHPTGVAAYHRDYPGRTTPLPGYETLTKEQTVSALRHNLTSNVTAMTDAPQEVLNSLHYMVNKYGAEFRDE